jgi:hypothetical protein
VFNAAEVGMSEQKTATAEIQVILGRPGAGARTYHLPEGATLADLLRQSGATLCNQDVFVNGIMSEETVPLTDRAVVFILPRPGNAAGVEPWRATIPAFRDEALFQEYMEALKARRRSAEPEEGPSA